MHVNRLTGSPWHKERVHRSEGDERRYKGRCKYYRFENSYCTYRCGSCIGSAHCNDYQAISEEEFKKRKKSRKKSGEDDCYWY